MPKRPRKPKHEDFNEAAFRVVREATEKRESGPQPDKPARVEKVDEPRPEC